MSCTQFQLKKDTITTVQGKLSGINVPSFKTKALVEYNFEIHTIAWLVQQACSDKAEFSILQRDTAVLYTICFDCMNHKIFMQKIKLFNIEHILTLTPISFVPNRTDTPELGNNCSTGAAIFAGVDSTKIDGWGKKANV